MQLGGTEQKGEKMIVVQAPDAMRPCWFEPVVELQLTHERDILCKDAQHHGFVIIFCQKAQFVETESKK